MAYCVEGLYRIRLRKLAVARNASERVSAPSGMSNSVSLEGCGACSLCVVRTPFHAKNFAGLDARRSAQNPPTASESTSRRRLASSSNVATNPAARTLGSHSQYARMKLPMDANTSGSEFQMSAAPSPSLSTA